MMPLQKDTKRCVGEKLGIMMKGTETGQLRCLVFLCTTRRCRNDFLVGLEKI